MTTQLVRRRAVAVAILAVAIAVVWLGPISEYLGVVADAAQRSAESRSLLERYRNLAAEDVGAARRHGGASPIMLPEAADGQTLAALQESINNVAASSQIELQSLQVLRGENVSGASKLGVRIRGTGEITGITRMLYAIESARPLLYPDNFSMRSRSDASGKPAERLDFQLDVSGFKAGPL